MNLIRLIGGRILLSLLTLLLVSALIFLILEVLPGDVASRIVERTISMIDRSGIREFYDPRTGDGEGARDFGWTTLVLDLIAAERGAV